MSFEDINPGKHRIRTFEGWFDVETLLLDLVNAFGLIIGYDLISPGDAKLVHPFADVRVGEAPGINQLINIELACAHPGFDQSRRIIAEAKVHPVGDPLAVLRPGVHRLPVGKDHSGDLPDLAQAIDPPVVLIHRFKILNFHDHLGRKKLNIVQVGGMNEGAVFPWDHDVIDPVFIHRWVEVQEDLFLGS